jgi:spore coat polysaccharide biosynthesis predicted glycosyltransferase SpsG
MSASVRFVVTAGPVDGRGHLSRALSLAEARWARGTTTELELVDGTLSDGESARAQAVGLRQVADQSPAAPGTLVVIDVPQPNPVAARFEPTRLAVFDDRDAFEGAAALVIQPSQGAWGGSGSAEKVLTGYDYVPIPAAVRRLRTEVAPPAERGGRQRVLVCFGGSDPSRVTERVVAALAGSLDADIDVVVGATYGGGTQGWPIPVLRDPPDLAQRLARADVALLGAGTMKFEAACLARPMVLVAVADDQLAVGTAFAATGAARFLGDGRTLRPNAVAGAVAALLADAGLRTRLGTTAARLVDGYGADRIAAAVERLGHGPHRQ